MAKATKDQKRKNNLPTDLPGRQWINRQCWGRLSVRNAAAYVLCLFVLLTAGCGGGDKKKADAATQKGWDALQARTPQAARDYFALALEACPTHPQANLGMAKVYDQFFFDNKAAVVFYKRYLDLSNDPEGVNAARQSLQALEGVDSGRLEDPVSAVDDLLTAAYAGRRNAFFERVSGEYLHKLAQEQTQPEPLLAQFGSFCLGGTPEVVYRMIAPNQQGAIVIVQLKNASEGSRHIQLALLRGNGDFRSLWLLADYKRLGGASAVGRGR